MEEKGGSSGRVMLEVYDFSPLALDRRFIDTLVKKFGKGVKLAGDVKYEQVEKMPPPPSDLTGEEGSDENGADNDGNDTSDMLTDDDAAPLAPAAGSGLAATHLNLMVELDDVRTYKYDISVEGGPYALADKMVVIPIEAGNVIRMLKGDAVLGEVQINSLESVPAVAEQKKGLLGEGKQNRKLAIAYMSREGAKKVSMTLDILDDGKVDEIVDQLTALRKLELSGRYFEYLAFEYRDAGGNWAPTQIFLTAPFLALGETVIWMERKMDGIISKRCKWLKAVTNFRAIYYNFEHHAGDAMMLRKIGGVVVANKRVESTSSHPHSGIGGASETSSRVFGDVHLLHRGTPFITLVSILDPEGVAALVRHAVEESQSNIRRPGAAPAAAGSVALSSPAGKLSAGAGQGGSSDMMVCPRCGSHNPYGSSFCNKCGSRLDYKCAKCGHVNATDARFCSQCGSQL